jgi:cytochrome c oxidase subunit 4
MNKSAEVVWLSLIVLSVGLLALRSFQLDPFIFSGLLLLITVIKGQLIIDYFMGLKSTRWRYRLIPTLWLVLVLSLVGVSLWV